MIRKIMFGLMYLMILLCIAISIFALPSPHAIRGYVLMDDGVTQADSGSIFSINDTDSGYYVEGTTGKGPSSPGKYSATVDGTDDDTIIVKAFNLTAQGNTTVALAGSMYNVNVILNFSRANKVPDIISSPSLTVAEDGDYTYDVDIDDPLDTFTFVFLENPSGMTIGSSNGLIEWTPSNDDVGLHNVHFNVTDSFGASDNQSFTINVTPVNDAPEIISSPNTSVLYSLEYYYDVNGTDIDNDNSVDYDDDTLEYSLTTYPVGMTIDSATGEINWTANSLGNKDVIVQVSDGSLIDVQSYTLVVTLNIQLISANAPVIISDAVTSAVAENLYTYDVDAADPNDDAITYALVTSPDGMTINAESGVIQWTPSNASAGVHTINVSASDGLFTGSQTFNLTVTLNNAAPVFTSTPSETVAEDTAYIYDANAFDDEVLTFSLLTFPDGMLISSTTGLITFTPDNSDVGDNNVTIKVTDGTSNTTQSYILNVTPVNDAPVISSSPSSSGYINEYYTYQVVASDPDNQNSVDYDDNNLTYTLTTYPTGMTIDSTYEITWLPLTAHTGTQDVVLQVSDNTTSTTQAFTVTVTNRQATTSSGGGGGGVSRSLQADEGTVDSEQVGVESAVQSGDVFSQFESISEDKKAKVKVEEAAVTELIISAGAGDFGGGSGINVKVGKFDSKPDAVSKEPESREIYQYLDIDIDDESKEVVGDTVVKFKIEREWLREKNQNTENVLLMRYEEDWEDLPTQFDYADDDYFYFVAITPGFSYFAITVKSELQSGLQAKSNPKIDPDAKIVSHVIKQQYHLYGNFYTMNGRTMVRRGLDYNFTNINNSFSVIGTTGFGRDSGGYSVILQSKIGDYIEVNVADWTKIFVLEGDGQKHFVTNILPMHDKILVVVLILIVIVTIIMIAGIKRRRKRIENQGIIIDTYYRVSNQWKGK